MYFKKASGTWLQVVLLFGHCRKRFCGSKTPVGTQVPLLRAPGEVGNSTLEKMEKKEVCTLAAALESWLTQ